MAYSNNGAGTIYQRTLSPENSTTSYSYNNLGQVVSVTNPNETFQYDAAGNMTCNQSGQYLTYNSIGELNNAYQTCGSTATQQDSFTYDAYGDRTNETFPWNGSTAPENYIYVNSLGEMIAYQIFYTQTNYVYSGLDQLMQINQNGSILAQMTYNEASSTPEMLSDSNWDFIYGPQGRVIEAIQLSNSSQHYMVNDPTGSVLINFSQNGTINDPNLYNTYGASPSSGAPPIGWDNSYYDGATGLYYMNNRFYDLTTGQFITQDPRILALNQPNPYAGEVSPIIGGMITQSGPQLTADTNPYQFGNDDPVNEINPTGLCATCNPTTDKWIAFGLSLFSLATSVGSLFVSGPGGLVLRIASYLADEVTVYMDAQGCSSGNNMACVSLIFDTAGAVSSTFGIGSSVGKITDTTVPKWYDTAQKGGLYASLGSLGISFAGLCQ